jgi:hypothetical protein
MSNSSEDGSHFELLCGITLAIFAAALTINDLGAGKFGDDELIAYGQGQQAYAWYASKGLKENLAEGQVGLLTSLVEAGAVASDKAPALQDNIADLTADIARYKKEKKEILLGSAVVGKENWVQDIDGKLGVVIGAKQYEATATSLSKAGDLFDLGTLFLQLCLVIGAISLILKGSGQKKFFYGSCVVLGLIGSFYAVLAYLAAMGAS